MYAIRSYYVFNRDNEIIIKGTNSEDRIEIYDIKGSLISKTVANKHITPIKPLTRGVYIVKINNYINTIII